MKKLIRLQVNGDVRDVAVEPWRRLVDVLREDLRLTGTKKACGDGDCGACTVIIDGRTVLSCLTLAVAVEGADIRTIEGVAESREALHPVQAAFVEHGAIQCGYCTPGMTMSAKFLLSRNRTPTDLEIRTGISGNLCRCTGYAQIVSAIRAAADRMRAEQPSTGTASEGKG